LISGFGLEAHTSAISVISSFFRGWTNAVLIRGPYVTGSLQLFHDVPDCGGVIIRAYLRSPQNNRYSSGDFSPVVPGCQAPCCWRLYTGDV